MGVRGVAGGVERTDADLVEWWRMMSVLGFFKLKTARFLTGTTAHLLSMGQLVFLLTNQDCSNNTGGFFFSLLF